MSKLQQGFTLIELMIVVAIIGILAAIAIPSYQDYTARAQVSEGMSLTSAFKTTLAEYYSDRGDYTPLTAAGGIAALGGSTSGKYVGSIVLADIGTNQISVIATFRSAGVARAIQSSTFANETLDGGLNWNCGANAGLPQASLLQLATKLVPGACKP